MQLAILSCEKMKLYDIYPEETWQLVLDDCREDLLNENYEISEDVNEYIGIGTIISFKQTASLISGEIDKETNIAILQLPEREGYEYLVKTVAQVADDVERCKFLPPRLSKFYTADHTEAVKEYEQQKEVYKEALKELPSEIPEEPVIHEDDQAGNTPV